MTDLAGASTDAVVRVRDFLTGSLCYMVSQTGYL